MFETVIAFQALYDEDFQVGMCLSAQIVHHILSLGIRPDYRYCCLFETRTTGKSVSGVKLIEASAERRNSFMEYRPPSQRIPA